MSCEPPDTILELSTIGPGPSRSDGLIWFSMTGGAELLCGRPKANSASGDWAACGGGGLPEMGLIARA